MKKLKRPPLCSRCRNPIVHVNDRVFIAGSRVCGLCADAIDDGTPAPGIVVRSSSAARPVGPELGSAIARLEKDSRTRAAVARAQEAVARLLPGDFPPANF